MKTTEQDHIIMAPNDENKEMLHVDLGNEDYEVTMKPPIEIASKEEREDRDEVGQASTTNEDATAAENDQSCLQSFLRRLLAFYLMFDFPIHILIGICLARAYPPLGAEYLRPQYTASWIATGIIFFLSGLGLKTSDLLKVALRRLYFNIFVEVFNFGVVSLLVFGVSRALASSGILPQPLADGLAMTACLPMSINAVIILTSAAHGDEAAAIFHTTVGNFCGIFLSPILIVLYLPSVTADVDLPKVFLDLTLKIVVPLVCGQIVHILIKPVRDFYYVHKKFFKKTQETCLVYIVYTVFCKKFNKEDEEEVGFGSIAIVIVFILLCMTSSMVLAWFSMKPLFHNEPGLRVMGVFGCTQKTIALGIPLILSIFGGTEYESLYTLPILIWHPMQLVVGSCIVGRLQKFMVEEKKRLGIVDEEDSVGTTSHAAKTSGENVEERV